MARIVGLLAVLAVAGAVALGVVLGSGSSQAPSGPITRAAFITMRQPGFRFAISVHGGLAGHTFSLGGSGSEQASGGRGSLDMTALGRNIHEIIVLPNVYVRTPVLPNGAPAVPTPWMKINVNEMMQAMGAGGMVGGDDPSQLLGLLRAAGVNRTLGREEVRGVPTTHYHGLADLTRYASLVPPRLQGAAQQNAGLITRLTGKSTVPVDVWVDGRHRVRRLRLGLSMCTRLGTLSEIMDMDFFHYGPQPTVVAPPAADVTNMSSRVSSTVSQAFQQLGAGC